jgi:hypothetical protein
MEPRSFEQALAEERAALRRTLEVAGYALVLGLALAALYQSVIVTRRAGEPLWQASVSLAPSFPWALLVVVGALTLVSLRLLLSLRNVVPVLRVRFRALPLEAREGGAALVPVEGGVIEGQDEDWGMQYLEYAVLREFCAPVRSHHVAEPLSWLDRILEGLRAGDPALDEGPDMRWYFGDYPISRLPEGVRSNVWLQVFHGDQELYERQVLSGASLKSASWTPFTLSFPVPTEIHHAVLPDERRLTFVTRYGAFSVAIEEGRWWVRSALPEGEEGYRVRLSFAARRPYALGPWLSAGFERYYAFVREKMEALEATFSLERHQLARVEGHLRSLETEFRRHAEAVQAALTKTAETAAQAPPAGDAEARLARHLRSTRADSWERRREGVAGLLAMVHEVPEERVDEVVRRLLEMSRRSQEGTPSPWGVVRALGAYGVRAEAPLARQVAERLTEHALEHPPERRTGRGWWALGRHLAEMQGRLPLDEQRENLDRIVVHFLSFENPDRATVAELCWRETQLTVRRGVLDSIRELVASEENEGRLEGLTYAARLGGALPLPFRRALLEELLDLRVLDVEVRLAIQRFICAFGEELGEEALREAVRYVLRGAKSAYDELREGTVETLEARAELFAQSDARTVNMVTRRLMSLTEDESAAVAGRALVALVEYVPWISDAYVDEVSSIFVGALRSAPPRSPRARTARAGLRAFARR